MPLAGPDAGSGHTAIALQNQYVSGAQICSSKAPAKGVFAGALFHHCCKPVAAGGEHVFFQHRAVGVDAGETSLQECTLGGCGLQLDAEGQG